MKTRYYIKRVIDGRDHWWRPKSYAQEPGWMSDIRNGQGYGSEWQARLALSQIRRHYPFEGAVSLTPYVCEGYRSIRPMQHLEGVMV